MSDTAQPFSPSINDLVDQAKVKLETPEGRRELNQLFEARWLSSLTPDQRATLDTIRDLRMEISRIEMQKQLEFRRETEHLVRRIMNLEATLPLGMLIADSAREPQEAPNG